MAGTSRWETSAPTRKLALFHGFLYEDGLLTQFDYQGAATTEVFDVDARKRGDFVGRFNDGRRERLSPDTSVARITRGT